MLHFFQRAKYKSSFECFAKSSEIVFYMNGKQFLKLKTFFFHFGPIFLHFWQIFQNKMSHSFENGCTTIFHLLLSNVFETHLVYYTILFIAFEFIFLSTFSAFLKSLSDYFSVDLIASLFLTNFQC